MTVYELIQELANYSPETEILFKCNNGKDEVFVAFDCNFNYIKLLNRVYIELE